MAKSKEKYTIIGDVHGQFDTIIKAASWAWINDATPVYLGDLTDSFSKSKSEQLRAMYFVLRDMDRGAICLWGNHDLSYLFPDLHKCSGYSKTKEDYFRRAYTEFFKHPNFRPYYWIGDSILVTHAGLSPKLVPTEFTPKEFLDNSMKDTSKAIKSSPLFKAGRSSGGPQAVGGITWLRSTECTKPLEGITQIVGHTPQGEIEYDSMRDIWYVDSLEYGSKEILLVNRGKIEKIEWERYAEL